MIHLILLTGFLGAGKTTLMTSILDAYEGQKIGVIVNEFGEINIDAVSIQRKGIEIEELSNGSIFCACIKDHFVNSLIALSKRDIDYLFIEASGLADPSNISTILQSIKHKTKDAYSYKGALCTVDGENFLELYDILPALHNQVQYSKTVIINKADLIHSDQIDAIQMKIHEINPFAEIQVTSYCRVDISRVINDMQESPQKEGETTNTLESRPKTFLLTGQEVLPYLELEKFIKEISKEAYRIKGFAITDRGLTQISTVRENIYFLPFSKELKESQIVVISSVGIKMLSNITMALEHNLKGKLHL